MSAEVRLGHGLPRLPASELVRVLGVLALVREGRPVADDGVHEAAGRVEAARLRVNPSDPKALETAVTALAREVDVRPLL